MLFILTQPKIAVKGGGSFISCMPTERTSRSGLAKVYSGRRLLGGGYLFFAAGLSIVKNLEVVALAAILLFDKFPLAFKGLG